MKFAKAFKGPFWDATRRCDNKNYVNFHLETGILNLIGSNVVIGTIFINIAVLLVYVRTA